MADYAYRKIESNTGYRKIEATITLPTISDLSDVASGDSLYNYLGMNGPGFDFEFGFGFDPSAGLDDEFGVYRSMVVGSTKDWAYTTLRASAGSTYRLMIAAENGKAKCYVYDANNNEIFQQDFNVSPMKLNGSNQRVRRVSALNCADDAAAAVTDNRWTSTLVATSTSNANATSSNCTASNVTDPSGNQSSWVSVTTYNSYYNENINLDIR
ncbi:hypothetical protein SAMN05444162_1459 [Paenibacillaceae bacterium GAS479]|nr:hypothetical protein SAMN05444162_1459 [Paenibacillaceae bacterium GAS479]